MAVSRKKSTAGIVPTGDFVRVGGLFGLRRLIARYGGNPAHILSTYGVPIDRLDDPEQYVTYRSVAQALEYCADIFDAPHFGLELVATQPADVLGAIAIMMRSANTVGEALEAGARLLVIQCPGAQISLTYEGDNAALSFLINDRRHAFLRQVNEASVAMGVTLFKAMIGPAYRPKEIWIASDPPPRGTQKAEHHFAAPVIYHQPFSAHVFDAEMLSQPLSAPDPQVHRLAANYLRSVIAKGHDDLVVVVRRLVVELLPLGLCSLATVAAHIDRHPRILQLELARRGCEFRTIVNEERSRLAAAYLASTVMPIFDIAAVLGYADQTTFTRAFSRWHGQSPLMFRKAHAIRNMQR